ncbi:hypothetical protein ALC57_04171 [Trachymyrmex cornetzi]|uniref:Uncharacterized protein n=1 Tax=Trachymyrmex cornetzi TaxID=471704 RepID=A0A195EDL7_9HYME|nr:hypothetical protein ALC57_04171 [Trachymyrmex cornetzi]
MNAGRSRLREGRGVAVGGDGEEDEASRWGVITEGDTGVEGSEGTEAGGVETRRVDTEWKESTERGRLLCAQTIPGACSCAGSHGAGRSAERTR